jgi:hypothetical protein
MAANYMQRVAMFEPYGRANAKGQGSVTHDDDFSDEEAPFNSSSSLLGTGDSHADDTWVFSLARLREQRRRPFLGSGIAMAVVGVLLILAASFYGLSFYRYWALGGADAFVLAVAGGSLAAAVLVFTCAHLWAISVFSDDPSATGAVRLTDFLQKISLLAVVASAALVLRLWRTDARLLVGIRTAGVLRLLLFPTRTWALVTAAVLALLLVAFILIGTSVPYRKPAYVYAAGVRTFALFALLAGVGAAALSLVTALSDPARYMGNALLWAGLGISAAAALLALGLAVSASQARRAAGVSKLWLLGALLAAGGVGAVSAFLYQAVTPDFMAPGVRSESLFAVAVMGFGGALCAAMAALVLSVWKFNEWTGAPKRASVAAHEMRGY